jgi:competence protein ComEA
VESIKGRFGVTAWGLLVAALMSTTTQAGSVDVNQASAQQLATVKGIGTVTAERIVLERARGLYESMAHLSERLSGIGPKRLEKLKLAGLCAGTAQKTCVTDEAAPLSSLTNSKTRTPTHAIEAVTPIVINLP